MKLTPEHQQVVVRGLNSKSNCNIDIYLIFSRSYDKKAYKVALKAFDGNSHENWARDNLFNLTWLRAIP